jgi:hypothetical protein
MAALARSDSSGVVSANHPPVSSLMAGRTPPTIKRRSRLRSPDPETLDRFVAVDRLRLTVCVPRTPSSGQRALFTQLFAGPRGAAG